MKWVLVFVGSGLGGCLRLGIGELTQKFINSTFPIGTLLANTLACIILGLVIGLTGNRFMDEKTSLFFTIGLCGGFSTFSTFSNETLELFANHKVLEGTVYIFISIILCLAAVYSGTAITKWLN